MKRSIKKLLSLFLTAALTVTFSVPVYAEEAVPMSGNSVIEDHVAAENSEEWPDQEVSIQSAGRSDIAMELDSVVAELDSLTPGIDYKDKEGVFIADSREEAERVAAQYNGTLKSYNHRVAVVRFKESTIEALETAATIDSADVLVEPNYIFHTMDVTDDTSLNNSNADTAFHLNSTLTNDPYADDTDPHYQYFHEKINTLNAHEITTGEGVKIAVIDTGCTPDHEDSGFDEDHSLYISSMESTMGKDTTVGHGIHCTGIIHEKKGNSLGGFGIAPGAEIYSIKIADYKSFTSDVVLEGFSMALERDVNVISMSLGSSVELDSFDELINIAYEKGITVIAAAGNESTDSKRYPAAYEHVISVAASDRSDKLADYSNYGDWVDIVAPGSKITSTYLYGDKDSFAGTGPGNTYGSISGTSMATPIVAGVAALCYAANPDLQDLESRDAVDIVTEAILNTTDGKEYTYSSRSVKGLIQADKAVEEIRYSMSKTYTLVDEAGNYGSYLRGTLARGKTVKLKIGDLQGNTKDKEFKKALKEAKWTSSSSSVTVKNGKVKCDKGAEANSEVIITAEIGGDTLKCKYLITEPLIGAGTLSTKMTGKGYKVKTNSSISDLGTFHNPRTVIDLRSPCSNITSSMLGLIHTKYTGGMYIEKIDPIGYLADDQFKYRVDINKKQIDNGSITLVKNRKGIPLKAVINGSGKYKIKFRTIDGSNKSFTFNITVKQI